MKEKKSPFEILFGAFLFIFMGIVGLAVLIAAFKWMILGIQP